MSAIFRAQHGIVPPRTGPRAAGGSGPWTLAGVNRAAGGAVLQLLPQSCVAACGEMLTAGAVSQPALIERIGVPASAEDLAQALNTMVETDAWRWGYFVDAQATLAYVLRGAMAGLLWAPGVQIGHMVVIETAGPSGRRFRIRDPFDGFSYYVNETWIGTFVAAGVFT
jgi:hypothetical protein